MTSSACDASGLLSCLTCELPLLPPGLPRPESVRCDAGHEVTLQDLVEGWRLRLGAIVAASDEARRRSMPEVADLYLDHAERIRGPLAHLLQTSAGAEESAA